MPQLDFTTYIAQFFWLAITFSVLYVVLAKRALPNIREVLQNRQMRIANDLKKAEHLKEEAEAAQADFTSVLDEARKKSQEMLAQTRATAEAEAARRQAKLDENFARQAKEAEHRIAVIRDEAEQKLVPVTTEFALEIAEKLIGVKLSSDKVEEAISTQASKQNKAA
jgi:F-type H+-transporting ATPase subunit b